jgi:hypothetical protein
MFFPQLVLLLEPQPVPDLAEDESVASVPVAEDVPQHQGSSYRWAVAACIRLVVAVGLGPFEDYLGRGQGVVENIAAVVVVVVGWNMFSIRI